MRRLQVWKRRHHDAGLACLSGGATSATYPQRQAAICISLSLHNSVVLSPIWTIDRSNDSHGPWLLRTPSIVTCLDTRLNHSQISTELQIAACRWTTSATRVMTPSVPSCALSLFAREKETVFFFAQSVTRPGRVCVSCRSDEVLRERVAGVVLAARVERVDHGAVREHRLHADDAPAQAPVPDQPQAPPRSSPRSLRRPGCKTRLVSQSEGSLACVSTLFVSRDECLVCA